MKKMSLFSILKKIIPLTYNASPKWFVVNCLLSVTHGLSWGCVTVALQWFVDSVEMVVNDTASYMYAFKMLFLLLIISVFQKVINFISNFLVGEYFSFTNGFFSKKMFLKLDNIDPICFEDPKVLDDINKANEGKRRSNLLLNIPMMLITFYLPYYLFMSIYLYSLRPIFVIIIPFVFIPVIISQLIRMVVYTDLETQIAPLRRKAVHYRDALCMPKFLKETRILGAYNYFNSLLIDTIKCINSKVWKTELKTGLYELLSKFVTLIGYMGIIILLIANLLDGKISVGAFAAVFSSISTLFSLFEDVICGMVGRLSKNMGSVKNYVNFLEIPERDGEQIEIVQDEIKFDNVYFKYPSQENFAIQNVSFSLPAKCTLGIVGENGSGKTTLIKLLTGLYLPTTGNVRYGNVDIKNISMEALFKNVSGVFQDFHKYKMTLSENVAISQFENRMNSKKILQSLSDADFVMNSSFIDKYDTYLSKEFGGIDLSGGQWQQIAIARGYFKNHSIIVLDEPTASIDPIEENKIYSKFREISKNKTAIVTTHRLGAVRFCDLILVMKDGKLIEQGTHEQLIKLNGHYAMMYNSQANWYN